VKRHDMRLDTRDPRFKIAQRLFLSESDTAADVARAILRELLRESWPGEKRRGRSRRVVA